MHYVSNYVARHREAVGLDEIGNEAFVCQPTQEEHLIEEEKRGAIRRVLARLNAREQLLFELLCRDDGSVVVNMAWIGSGSQSVTYQVSVDEASNSYSVVTAGTQQIPPCIAASVALYTARKSDGSLQLKTTNLLKWRVVNGTVGVTSWNDLHEVLNGGGLTWTIRNAPVDPPYTTSPTNANLINDTSGKYKNFDFGDPTLSTIVVAFIRIDHEVSDPDINFRGEVSHKVTGEGARKFIGLVVQNFDIPPGC